MSRSALYATCWDEMEVGLGAIAVPIHLPDIGVIYSLGTAGLIDRLTRRPVTKTVALLRAALEPMIRALRNREPTDAPEARSQIKERLATQQVDSPASRVQQARAGFRAGRGTYAASPSIAYADDRRCAPDEVYQLQLSAVSR
jgi:hypothetical protein